MTFESFHSKKRACSSVGHKSSFDLLQTDTVPQAASEGALDMDPWAVWAAWVAAVGRRSFQKLYWTLFRQLPKRRMQRQEVGGRVEDEETKTSTNEYEYKRTSFTLRIAQSSCQQHFQLQFTGKLQFLITSQSQTRLSTIVGSLNYYYYHFWSLSYYCLKMRKYISNTYKVFYFYLSPIYRHHAIYQDFKICNTCKTRDRWNYTKRSVVVLFRLWK